MTVQPPHILRCFTACVLLAAALVVGLAGCDPVDPVEERQLVVEAFLPSEQPLGPITLRATQPLNKSDAEATAATGAAVTLRLDGQSVAYRPVGDGSGRYMPEMPDTVRAHAPFEFEARWEGQIATAHGTVPRPIAIEAVTVEAPSKPVEAILVDSLRRDSLDIPAEEGYIYPIEVTVSWAADFPDTGPDSAYWVRAQLRPYEAFDSRVVDFFLQPEAVFRERSVSRQGDRRRWQGIYAVPVAAKDAPLPQHGLRITLVRSGADYAAFATSRDDPERREPISNIQGGLGIAAAIALDSVRVEVGADRAVP